MAPRLSARPARENDFSDVGKVGRRTGVTLPQGQLDTHGMEEISGIFSSPRKPSPLKNSITIMESVEERGSDMTPKQTLSVRKSIPPRSASPRKSGIRGTARRSNIMDIENQQTQEEEISIQEQNPSSPFVLTPNRPPSTRSTRLTRTPLLDTVLSAAQTARNKHGTPIQTEDVVGVEGATRSTRSNRVRERSVELGSANPKGMSAEVPETLPEQEDYALPLLSDVVHQDFTIPSEHEETPEFEPLQPQYDDEDADETFQPEARTKPRSREPTIANSRRKRKSDAVEQDVEVDMVSSPAAKRAKRISHEGGRKAANKRAATSEPSLEPSPEPVITTQKTSRGRPRGPLRNRDTNSQMSTRQEKELQDVVEKIRARPGQNKSLYVLRRETPADEGVTHTRSGRISVKPLAYWRNEKCVFGGSPGGASLQDGARFPLNSIREIIRTDVVENANPKKSKKGKNVNGKRKARSQSAQQTDSSSDEDENEEQIDQDAEPWETDNGTFRGRVQVWDTEQQAPIDEDEEIEVAYASAAIQTKEVKGSTFRYAKLLSTRFFGSGIVELPSGAVKRPKNSRKMHMSFFVATGRVTVQVGPINGPESRFSIGKGGFWQVPRGNQYSIENEHEKTAKIFFSQACETMAPEYEE